MGAYSSGLSSRLRGTPARPAPRPDVERLHCAAIQRDGETHSGPRSHYELRSRLGDADPHKPNRSDVEGFMTSTGRFVTRKEAQDVALPAGQIRHRLQRRPLLSSDIEW